MRNASSLIPDAQFFPSIYYSLSHHRAYLAYIPRFFPDVKLDAYPNLSKYVETLSARPAFINTVGAPPPSDV